MPIQAEATVPDPAPATADPAPELVPDDSLSVPPAAVPAVHAVEEHTMATISTDFAKDAADKAAGTAQATASTMHDAAATAADRGRALYADWNSRTKEAMDRGAKAFEQLGDFYLYPLPGRTTIADQQTKQVSFLDVKGAPATAAYEYRNDWLGTKDDPESVSSVLRFSSAKEAGLGDALPAGTVRVYQRDARGQAQFTGESPIPHTPQGSSISLRTGAAFDVKVKPTVVERARVSPLHWRTKMRHLRTTPRARAVTVDLVQSGLDWWISDTGITQESQKSERRDADAAMWHVSVPANGQTTVTATFDTRY